MKHVITISCLLLLIVGYQTVEAQGKFPPQVQAIFERNCLNCHGPHGAFTEQIVIESRDRLISSGSVVPGRPSQSELYTRLLEEDSAKRMPLGQPPLTPAAINTIRQWIDAGARSVNNGHPRDFIPNDAMLAAMQRHLATLDGFDRPYARYFTTTHLYNAGEAAGALSAYQVALSKLVNSLSWGFEIHNPEPIGAKNTIFYIDLRDYEWDRVDAWTEIENAYPYAIEYNEVTQSEELAKLTDLQTQMKCEVPFVHVDWFLANAALPPLYHDILDLPKTDRELERKLDVDVQRNLQTAPGVRVWRAGFNDSGVSNNNRVVERHTSRYGAYWKSYDFAGSTGTQNVFTHPLSFKADGGEIIFNLPNGLQAYYILDASGNRLNSAPPEIVIDPSARDPIVHNGLSCIGCHTEGTKRFEDEVRGVINRTVNPGFDKAQALRLYVERATIEGLLAQDSERYRVALEATGGVFGGIEPVHRFHEAFRGPVEAPEAAAAVDMKTEAFLAEIRNKPSLQRLGLTPLLSGGTVKRDVWTERFKDVVLEIFSPNGPVDCHETDTCDPPPPDTLDPNLRAAIVEALRLAPSELITEETMKRLTRLVADRKGIRHLTRLDEAINLERIELRYNAISDLTPLKDLRRLNDIKLRGNRITDVSPLAGLINVGWLGLEDNEITDVSPLRELVKLNGIGISGNPVSDISALASLISLEGIAAWNTSISDFSALARLPRLRWIEFGNDKSITRLPSLKELGGLRRLEINNCSISDISALAALTQLTTLKLNGNFISDLSPLTQLKNLTDLHLTRNIISDVSPLRGLTGLRELYLDENIISEVSPLARLTNLNTLQLKGNAISDFSPLKGLPADTYVGMERNPAFPTGGPKIAGPWLWAIVPSAGFLEGKDLLAQATNGAVTEEKVSTNGATAGKAVGDSLWISSTIKTGYGNNLNEVLDLFDLEISEGDKWEWVMYGVVILDSPREQKVTMFAGSDNNHKAWLNGKLVNENYHWHNGYQEVFPVTLKQGKNVLLTAVHTWGGGWSGHFGFAPDTEYNVISPVGARFAWSTATKKVGVGDTFTLHFTAEDAADLAGWQTDIIFDPAVIRAKKVNEGGFLKQGNQQTFFKAGEIKNALGKIVGVQAARIAENGGSGEGALFSVRFTAKAPGKSRVLLRNFSAGSSTGKGIAGDLFDIVVEVAAPPWDVNQDGVTDAADVTLVRKARGQSPPRNPRTDVNKDGVVNEKDVAVVTAHLGEGADRAAPPHVKFPLGFTREMVEQTLDILRRTDDGSVVFQRGITNLKHLLAAFIPEETVLFHNYPNPFNPETWIPYQLAESANVTFHIYSANGFLVRRLELGHQTAGIYQHRSRAAHWDGRNEAGEPVASGVYFYRLTAGNFTDTRKMLIMK